MKYLYEVELTSRMVKMEIDAKNDRVAMETLRDLFVGVEHIEKARLLSIKRSNRQKRGYKI